ncbi:MAG: hypothetical protein WC375_07000 [Methanomassiliicoccales archaeon]|jgi:hypothetical protein
MRKVRVVEEGSIVIPELENAPDYRSRNQPWTERDLAILLKYWGKKDSLAVAKALNRTVEACKVKHYHLREERRV